MADRFAIQQVTSLTRSTSRLRALANNAIAAVKDAQEETAKNIIKDLQANYSTAEEGETYQRTGDMGGSWGYIGPAELSNGSIQTTIFNDVTDSYGRPYAGLVQGTKEQQTWRHYFAGWRQIDELRSEHLREQTNRVRAAINRAGR